MDNQLASAMAMMLQAIDNCKASGNKEWEEKHKDRLDWLVRNEMPSGSGIDTGTKLDDESTPERLVFTCSFHHMDESGGYDGWTEHKVIVTASLVHGIFIRVTGRDRNDIKEYLHEVYAHCINRVDNWPFVAHTALGD